jgi:hypothetical protein
MLVPLVEFKEKYGSRSLENIHIWYFLYSRYTILELCEFCFLSTGTPERTAEFCSYDRVVRRCRKSEMSTFSCRSTSPLSFSR